MDNKNLRKALEIYKEDTLKIISSLERDNFDALESLINMRQQTIDSINNIEHTQQEFLEIAEDIQILLYQKKLADLMLKKRNEVRSELNKMSSVKNASYVYNKRIYNNSVSFNKSI